MAVTALQRRSAVASVLLELCGVIKTFGTSWNGGGTAAAPARLGWDIATRHRAGTAQVALFQRGIKRILVLIKVE